MQNNVCTVHTFIILQPLSPDDEGKQTILNGFSAAGITDAVRKTRLNSVVDSLNPYL